MVYTNIISTKVSKAYSTLLFIMSMTNANVFLLFFSYSYLHSCSPPIILGNLTCDTIFIHNNGLIKIGSVAPDAIHYHVKTCRENIKNVHFIAPEYGSKYKFNKHNTLHIYINNNLNFFLFSFSHACRRYLCVWHVCIGNGRIGNPR